jgi:hypothetical protein
VCGERVWDEAAAAIRRCDDLPECAALDQDFVSDILGYTNGVLGPFADTIFCDEACGNGALDAGEACDPLASPTG